MTAATAAFAIATAGCAAQDERASASDTATRFLRAAQGGDVETACALLTPRTRDTLVTEDGDCATGLPADELTGAVTRADTWSDWAKVDTDAGSLFLAEFESGWLVSAAGCRPDEDAPYHCLVGG
ncbi:hypothetical protein [Actinophytocola sp. KF-1]